MVAKAAFFVAFGMVSKRAKKGGFGGMWCRLPAWCEIDKER